MTTVRIISINIYEKDAIGNFCYDLAAVYQKNGFDVQLYAVGFDSGSPVKSYEHLFSDVKKEDIIFYHFSIYDVHAERVANIDAKKIVYFHGITPPELLKEYQPITAQQCEDGLAQLHYLNQFDVLCVNSNSTFNQLKNYIDPVQIPHIIPPIVSCRNLLQTKHIKKIKSEKKTLLCVGRIVPHKKIEDVIETVSAFTTLFPEIDLQLEIVGAFPETDYQTLIFDLIKHHQLENTIIFKGFVSDTLLQDSYSNADCYIIMSEHEGFGVTLLEALKSNVPILAYAKNSIGEVLGDAGCQFDQKEFNYIANQLYQLLMDDDFSQTILLRQQKQFQKIMSDCHETVFLKLLPTV